MQKLSPLMKGLVETRARVDAKYIRLASLIANLKTKIEKVEAERDSCDQLITKLNNSIKAHQIEPINAWQGRYGQRGALSKEILNTLQQAYPKSISTSTIALQVETTFQLTFYTRAERVHWAAKSLASRLSKLARDNIIERLHNPHANTGQPGLWRWIPKDSHSPNLQALASSTGVPVIQAATPDPLEFASMLEADAEDDDLPR